MLIECDEDHCFHMKCLSEHRERVTQQFGGNGINKCPNCRETYSPVVKVFCPKCKGRFVTVNLTQVSDRQGAINRDLVMGKYGETCPDCE